MKKYWLLLALLISIDLGANLFFSTNLMAIQSDYLKMKESLIQLRKTNEQLTREVAHLGSLKRINGIADEIGLEQDSARIIFVDKDQFAMR